MAIHLGYVQMSVTSAVVVDITALSTTQLKQDLSYIEITPETNGLRWRADGTNPTASVGRPVAAAATAVYDDPAKVVNGNFKIVSQTGTSTVNIDFWGGVP